jgi:prepilin-type N-terminal cleavage/methylation domain-containing protein
MSNGVQRQSRVNRRAFTLVEVLIVVIILGILATIIIGVFTNGTADAAHNALKDDLRSIRSALQVYIAHHGSYPSAGSFEAQMTEYTDASGATSASKTATHVYGPYLHKLPPLPLGSEQGNSNVTSLTYTTGFGWGYDPITGQFRANLPDTEVDREGVAYNTY